MRLALAGVVLLVSSTASAESPRVALSYGYKLRTEAQAEWFPTVWNVRLGVSERLSLTLGFDFFQSHTVHGSYGLAEAPTPVDGRRSSLAILTGSMFQVSDHVYGIAGVGSAYEMVERREPWMDDFVDEEDAWRPLAYVGSGFEWRGPDHVGGGFEVRGIATGGSGPRGWNFEVPQNPTYAIQASLLLLFSS